MDSFSRKMVPPKTSVFIIAFNFLLCHAGKPQCDDLYAKQITNIVQDGSAAEYPFVVRVWARHDSRKTMAGTGFIISERHVVTSAHIVSVLDHGSIHRRHSAESVNVTIALGGTTERTVGVRNVYFKDRYIDTSERRNDIAVLKLSEKLSFSPEVKKAFLSLLPPKRRSAILAAAGCTQSVNSELKTCRVVSQNETHSSSPQDPSPGDDEGGEVFIDEDYQYTEQYEIIDDPEAGVTGLIDHGSPLFLPARVRTYTVNLEPRIQCVRRMVPYELLCGGSSDSQGQKGDSGSALVIYDLNGYAYIYGVYAGTRSPIGPGHLEFVSISYACEWLKSVTKNQAVCRVPDRVTMLECTP